jgi:hypothetical protein
MCTGVSNDKAKTEKRKLKETRERTIHRPNKAVRKKISEKDREGEKKKINLESL